MTLPVTLQAERSTLVRHVAQDKLTSVHHPSLSRAKQGPFDRCIVNHKPTTCHREIRLEQMLNHSGSSLSYVSRQSDHKFLIDIEEDSHCIAKNSDAVNTKYDYHQG